MSTKTLNKEKTLKTLILKITELIMKVEKTFKTKKSKLKMHVRTEHCVYRQSGNCKETAMDLSSARQQRRSVSSLTIHGTILYISGLSQRARLL